MNRHGKEATQLGHFPTLHFTGITLFHLTLQEEVPGPLLALLREENDWDK